jgi:DNA-binding NtrC family response regulator
MTKLPLEKLVLAVQDPALCSKLEQMLRGEDVLVRLLPDLSPLAAEEIDADLVVLRAENLALEGLPHALLHAGEADAPGVVVWGHGESAEERVRWVAAGASAVIDARGDRAGLVEQLLELVEAQAEGGIDGPEAGGSVVEPSLADFHSRSPRMRDFLDVVRRVASSDSTLLVTGETGVGKERLARAIHAESKRQAGPFVAVNCGALAENLLESELFGHERGAFTGATGSRKGHFESANAGTIFLDEVGEMPLHLQVKLLTVLQRHEVQPVGASKPRVVDVRIIAATNRDLRDDLEEGRFREDLFFRLNVISLEIPPLRERREDIPWFVGRFLRHFTTAHDRVSVVGIAEPAMEALLAYVWPGNVRELVNVIERGVLLCDGAEIRLEDLPETLHGGSSMAAVATKALDTAFMELPLQEARRQLIEDFERRYFEHHLRATRGAVGEVSAAAGINPRTLYEKMRRLGLRKEDYR